MSLKEVLSGIDVEEANQQLAKADALDIIRWAGQTFGDSLVMTSSFGAQAAVMLHLCTRIIPDIPVVWVDTGYLFPETYKFAQELAERLSLNLKVYQPAMTPARMEALHGKLWEQGVEGLNRYDQICKVEPMRRGLKELRAAAWVSGVRAQQTEFRASLKVVEKQDGQFKVHPILRWTTKDVHTYLVKHDLPYHPMYFKGYKSIGDWHSTRAIHEGESDRAGRFLGLKQECGIHLPSSQEADQSLGSAGI